MKLQVTMPTMFLLHPPPLSARFLILKSRNPTELHQSIFTSIRSSTDGIKSQAFFISSVGYQPSVHLSPWNLGPKHIQLLSVAACVVAISTSWLFFSAIPTLLAFKRAAESLEKLLDVTAKELPDTMAGVRLSGMEISDLTMELSDISQEITQGVRSSTRAIRLAEDRLRRLTTMAPLASVQMQTPSRDEIEGPAIARAARNLREGIFKGRSVLGLVFGITQFSRWAMNFLASRQQKPSV